MSSSFYEYPLIDFLDETALKYFLKSIGTQFVNIGDYSGMKKDLTGNLYAENNDLILNKKQQRRSIIQSLKAVKVAKFVSYAPQGRSKYYSYELGLNSSEIVGILLSNPCDTIIAFGNPHKEADSEADAGLAVSNEALDLSPDLAEMTTSIFPTIPNWTSTILNRDLNVSRRVRRNSRRNLAAISHENFNPEIELPPAVNGSGQTKQGFSKLLCDFNIRITLNESNALEIIQIFGASVKIYFSKKLVKPLTQTDDGGKYTPTGERQRVDLKQAKITLARRKTPHLSMPLVFEDNVVQIANHVQGHGIVAKLKKVTLGGTFQKPKIIFDEVELLYQ